MAALTLITDTKRAPLPLQCIYNTYISRGSTMETQSSVYNHFVLTLLLESESRFVNKYNQPRLGKTTQVRVMVMVCSTVGEIRINLA